MKLRAKLGQIMGLCWPRYAIAAGGMHRFYWPKAAYADQVMGSNPYPVIGFPMTAFDP